MSKTFFNDNLAPKIIKTIDEFKNENKETFLTSESIKRQIGRYIVDNCSPDDSFNANFGRYLKNNENKFKIKQIEEEVKIRDDYNNETSCSRWKILK